MHNGKQSFFESRLYVWLCAVVFVIAFALRMAQPDLVEFKRDEATITRLGQAIAYERYRPVVGVDSSVGIDNLPLTLYLMALPLRILPDPISAVIFTTFLNAIAVVVCYWLTQRIYGKPAALLATVLFAVNPWAILYARKIWARTLPIATLGFIVSNIAVFIWDKRWALIGAFVSLAALIGLQLEGIAFIPVFTLLLLLYRDKVSWQPFIVGCLIFVILLLPYCIFDANQNWQNLRGLLEFTGSSGSLSWDALRYSFSLAGTSSIDGQAGGLYRQFRTSVPNLWFVNNIIFILLGASFLYGGLQIFTAKTRERRRLFTILLLWFIVPLLLQLRTSTSTQRHYFVMHYPVQFMMLSIFVVDTLCWLRKRIQSFNRIYVIGYRVILGGLVCLLLVWVLWQVAITNSLRLYMVAHPTTGGYGIPLKYTRSIAHDAIRAAGDSEIIVVSESTHPFITETPTVFDALLFGHPHRFVDGRGALPFPKTNQTLYLVGLFSGSEALPPLVTFLTGLESVSPGPAIILPDGHAYRTYIRSALDTQDIESGLTPLKGGVSFGNNVVFSGYRVTSNLQPGGYLYVTLGWWLHGPPPEGIDYHFTMQLQYAAEDHIALVSQDDQDAFPAEYWKGGDMVLSTFSLLLPLELPPGPYQLRAGMYSYPEIISVPVINQDGETVDESVTLVQYEVANK